MGYRFDRAYYRLVYPLTLRPTIRLGDEAFPVVDLSEQGVRYLDPGPGLPAAGTPISGKIQLQDSGPVEVEGTVVRADRRAGVAVHLTRGIPFKVMLEQQRYLSKRVIGRR